MHGAVDTTLIAAICVYLIKELVLPAVSKMRGTHNPGTVEHILQDIHEDLKDLKDYVFQNLPRRK